jgi:hypothetical protein
MDANRGKQYRWLPRRDMVAFWLLGMTNNFPYVVMLSAAADILAKNNPGLGACV